ncbi:hypothetical protein COV16_02230 [Candidatus Woesearchaeota archaeon CG10_big_fil_rev_8_21_14_0_10_34_8]|nr:MAG: hypothetical protein COV16_02230 [Candidatus Woesearchaeota archaeon CG10_big_fil_rev_8_21_14_0_10_34_8]
MAEIDDIKTLIALIAKMLPGIKRLLKQLQQLQAVPGHETDADRKKAYLLKILSSFASLTTKKARTIEHNAGLNTVFKALVLQSKLLIQLRTNINVSTPDINELNRLLLELEHSYTEVISHGV